ncbi:FAD-dependent oxidoreductase [Aquabacterium sp. J223]|uniref:FAD-dependent oxidoreductase n=1 Tax=Aquabacterium sp. J223 TaxID=2898431 RepID=UPI0021AD7355|nr:FAD-dependent oxidoreductase [Aquabacterium sp. J223]UUX97073.1 FAD-dependent oxidoreductase [Aquabacterium sp. J223]
MKTVQRSDERILSSDIFDRGSARGGRADLGRWQEPARDIPVYHRTQVLVVGGGPSGTAAAAAAAKAGADVTLLERYNHLGGLSTGGLVIWIDRMTDWQGELVIRGFAEELFDRLPADAVAGPSRADWGNRDPAKAAYWSNRTAAYHGVVTWSPTIDPERLKLLSQDIVLERKVKLVYHSWACQPIVEGGVVKGVTFESKEGRMAILADVVVDATGDGDLFARAGAAFDNDIEEADVHHCMNTSWLFGGVDMNRWIDFKTQRPDDHAAFMAAGREACGLFERPFVSWRNDIALFMGPRQSGYSALDVDDLTEVEVRSHNAMRAHLDFFKARAPGFENAYLMLSAPQIGVRHARRLKGLDSVLRSRWSEGTALPDEVGVTPAVSPKFPNISIPYGALVPVQLDGLLACGRHVSCDKNSHGFMREIPQCWITGQAAGTAAALAAQAGVQPRAVAVPALQAALQRQGVFLRPGAPTAEAGVPAAAAA